MLNQEALLTLEEVNARIEELEKHIDALEFMRDLHYLTAEGFLEMEGDRLYPGGESCPNNL